MDEKLYERIVSLLRQEYPELSLDNVITDIEKAVEDFGIKVKYSDMSHIKSNEEISGYVHVVDGKPEIVVNGLQRIRRQRFTIAHELGHILLHWKWLPKRMSSDNILPKELVEVTYRKEIYLTEEENQREKQANEFAAEFLAPLKKVLEFLQTFNNPDREVEISAISEKFNISNAAAFYRWKKAKEAMNEY